MELYETRLATFATAKAGRKKRTSTAKGTKSGSWPHETPSPAQLAQAGFFFEPTASAPDQVSCFACQKSLDGWEPEDDPIKEHLQFSSDCAWAIVMALEQCIDEGKPVSEHPCSEKMVTARRETFADRWPHETKRGWTCKIQKMVDAGWYYCPTADSDDFVKCPYCSLSLDGWEPKDKPLDEHQRRSPHCTFFDTPPATKTKASRTRKPRASKVSRLSTASTATALREDESAAEATCDEGDSIMSRSGEVLVAKTTRAPKVSRSKVDNKTMARPADESAMIDDVTADNKDEIEMDVTTTAQSRGRKRTSQDVMATSEEDPAARPAKRRITRTRPLSVTASRFPDDDGASNAGLTDGESLMAAPEGKKPKKSRGRKVSATRKASKLSTASKASLRADMPDDDMIEAALEADLDRPASGAEDNVLGSHADEDSGAGARRRKASKASMRQAPRHSGEPEPDVSLLSKEPASKPAAAKKTRARANSKKAKAGHPVKPETPVKRMGGEAAAASQQHGEPPDITKPDQSPRSLNLRTSPSSVARDRRREPQEQIINAKSSPATQDAEDKTKSEHNTMEEDSGNETDQSTNGRRANQRGRSKRNTQSRKDAAPTQLVSDAHQDQSPKSAKNMHDSLDFNPLEAYMQLREGQADASGTEAGQSAAPSALEASEAGELNSQSPRHNDPQMSAERRSSRASIRVHCDTATQAEKPQQAPSPTPSPQSSDAENHPPSTRPAHKRPPLGELTPQGVLRMRHLAVNSPLSTTPTKPALTLSASRSGLHTAMPWTAADVDQVLARVGADEGKVYDGTDKENVHGGMGFGADQLTSPEKRMTVEQWVQHRAVKGEERLRLECEGLVGRFEREGMRALRALEGITCRD